MIYKEYLKTDEWKRIRRWALDRAGHKCQLCQSTKNLNVHHNNYKNLGKEEPADIIVLCKNCHTKHHKKSDSAILKNTNVLFYQEIETLIEKLKNTIDDAQIRAILREVDTINKKKTKQ